MNSNNKKNGSSRVLIHVDKRSNWRKVLHNDSTLFVTDNQIIGDSFCWDTVANESQFLSIIRKLVSPFSLIIETPLAVYASTDLFRNFPLIFSHEGLIFSLTNNAERLLETMSDRFVNMEGVREFLTVGHTIGDKTLIRSVYSLGPGEYVVFDKASNSYSVGRYCSFLSHSKALSTKNNANAEIQALALDCVSELLDQNHGRRIVVPLRQNRSDLILLQLLAQKKCQSVTAVTGFKKTHGWGRQLNAFSQHLGIPIIFIRYTRTEARKMFFTEQRKKYFRFASNTISLPEYSDFQLINYLLQSKRLESDFLIADGSASVFDLGYLTEFRNLSEYAQVTENVNMVQRYFNLWPEFLQKRRNSVEPFNHLESWSGIEDELAASQCCVNEWEWRELLPKKLGNLRRLYEFFQVSHELPFLSFKALKYIQGLASQPTDSVIGNSVDHTNVWKELAALRAGRFARCSLSDRFLTFSERRRAYDYLSYYFPDNANLSIFGRDYFLRNYKKVQHNREASFIARHFLDEMNIFGHVQDNLPGIIKNRLNASAQG